MTSGVRLCRKKQQAKNVVMVFRKSESNRSNWSHYPIRELYHFEIEFSAFLVCAPFLWLVLSLPFQNRAQLLQPRRHLRVIGIQIVSPFKNRQRGHIVSQHMQRGGEQSQRAEKLGVEAGRLPQRRQSILVALQPEQAQTATVPCLARRWV